MELHDFIKTVVTEAVTAVEESSRLLNREMHIAKPGDNQSIIFDIAVTAESATASKKGIKVLEFFAGSKDNQAKDSSISRIKFGVYINTENNDEQKKSRQITEQAKYA